MPRPKTKKELIEAANTNYQKLNDVIDSMRRIGNEMSSNVKETGKGGLAVTESAKKMLIK